MTEGTKDETRVCQRCKQALPLHRFTRTGRGYARICRDCQRAQKGISDRFRDFTARELIEELRNRGYKGTLTFTRVEQVKI